MLSPPHLLPLLSTATEVEAVLFQHPGVHQAAVFGVPNRVLGELVGAAVTLRPAAQVSAVQLALLILHVPTAGWESQRRRQVALVGQTLLGDTGERA